MLAEAQCVRMFNTTGGQIRVEFPAQPYNTYLKQIQDVFYITGGN